MKLKKQLAAVISAVILFSAISFPVSAEELVEEDGKIYCIDDNGELITGWHTINGKTYYFFSEDGSAATENIFMDGIRWQFSSDGVCMGKYTGFSGKGSSKYYFIKGVVCKKGWLSVNGKIYFFDSDGKMKTETFQEGGYEYILDKNGVLVDTRYVNSEPDKPKTVGEYLELTDFFAKDAEYRIDGNEFIPMKNKDKKRFFELLSDSSECELVYGKSISFDEIEAPDIYGDDCVLLRDIWVRFKNSDGNVSAVWYFQKDKEGNGYFCQNTLNFGVVLNGSEIYDMLKEAYLETKENSSEAAEK